MTDIDNHPLKKRYNLDSALNSFIQFYKKWFMPLFGISLASTLITSFMSSGIDISGFQGITDPAEMIALMKPMAWRYMLIVVIGLYFNLILLYFIIVRPLQPESDLQSQIIRVTTRYFFPVLVIYITLSILAMVAMMLGVVILFVGAIFAAFYSMIFFSLTAPVMMIEDRSIGDSLSRIFKLGHRQFWVNMGYVALFAVLFIIITLILSAIVMIPFTGGFLKSILNSESVGEATDLVTRPSYIILGALASALTMPLFPIFSLILYFNNTTGIEENILVRSGNQGSGRVTVEDLYAGYERDEEDEEDEKDNDNRWDDAPAPTVEDLTP